MGESSLGYPEECGATASGEVLGQNTDVILRNPAKQTILSFPVGLKNNKRESKRDSVRERTVSQRGREIEIDCQSE